MLRAGGEQEHLQIYYLAARDIPTLLRPLHHLQRTVGCGWVGKRIARMAGYHAAARTSCWCPGGCGDRLLEMKGLRWQLYLEVEWLCLP